MNATPRRRFSGWRASDESILGMEAEHKGDLITIPARKGTVVFECEIRQPKSSEGRTIYVYFQEDDLTDALKVLRDAAIYARSQPMSESER